MTHLVVTVLAAPAAAFGLALLSAVAGFGGGVLLLPVFTVLFGLRAAVPMLTLTQLSSNGSRVWLNDDGFRCGGLVRRLLCSFGRCAEAGVRWPLSTADPKGCASSHVWDRWRL